MRIRGFSVRIFETDFYKSEEANYHAGCMAHGMFSMTKARSCTFAGRTVMSVPDTANANYRACIRKTH